MKFGKKTEEVVDAEINEEIEENEEEVTMKSKKDWKKIAKIGGIITGGVAAVAGLIWTMKSARDDAAAMMWMESMSENSDEIEETTEDETDNSGETTEE